MSMTPKARDRILHEVSAIRMKISDLCAQDFISSTTHEEINDHLEELEVIVEEE